MRQRNTLVGAFFITLLITIGMTSMACTMTGHATQETAELRLGMITPLSGWGAYWGLPEAEGARIAEAELNAAGGIDGRRVHVTIEDSKGTGEDAVTAAQRLLMVDEIVGGYVAFTTAGLAAEPLFRDANTAILMSMGGAIQPEYTTGFKTFPDYYDTCKRMVEHRKAEDPNTRIVAILATNEYAELCLQGGRSVDENIPAHRYAFGETDFRTLLTKAASEGADTILIVGWADEAVPFFQQRTELGLDHISLLCGIASDFLPEEVLESTPEKSLENVVTFDFADLRDTPFATQYYEKHPQRDAGDLVPAAGGYEAVTLLANAARGCTGTNGEIRACIVKHLEVLHDYPSALKSTGFVDRNLQMETWLYRVKGKELVPI